MFLFFSPGKKIKTTGQATGSYSLQDFPRGKAKTRLAGKSPGNWPHGGKLKWEGLRRCVRSNRRDVQADQRNFA